MNTKITSGRRAAALLLFFVLLVSLMTGISNAASIQDGAKSASMTLGHRKTILETTAGTRLRACAYSYTTDNGLTGVGYCVDHGLDFTSRSLPITGKYLSSPVTAGVYANGYPQHSLYTFKSLFAGDYPELNALTGSEYQYATQLAIWASLGQLGIAGTNHTVGRESIAQPSGDAQQERVLKAVQCLLKVGDTWGRVYQTGAYIRLERDELGGNISIPADMSLETAANSEAYGIRRETIGGKVYYTRTYYVASATSTYYNNYNIDLWVTGAPSGTMFTYPGTNEELPHGMFREQATWAAHTAIQYTNLNANGYEYVAQVKLVIPADNVSNAGEITIHMATYPTQYNIYLCENTEYTEQSYIIADPSQGVIQNEAVLSWGSDITLTGDLIVQKVDGAGNPLAGAHFVLTGTDGSSRTGVSDGSGKVVWEKLDPTVTYTLTESQAPAGYGIMEAININIDAARDNFVTVRDDISKRLTVHKQDRQNGYSLQGAVIVFEQIDGTFKTERKTDHAGNIQLSADDLPVGSYKVYEKSAPLGYETDPNPQTVNWDGLHDVTLLFENTRKKTITIAKVDADTGYSLPHCTLAVYKNGQHIGDYTTNDNGLAYVSDVTTGDYVIREIIAPEGYVLDATDHIIHVDNYDPATTDDPRIVIKNHKKAQLTIVKYDAETGKGLPGVSFEVLRDTSPIGTYTTDSHGEIFLYDLEPGTYLVRESAAPAGYVLDTTPQEIKLEAGVWEYRLVFLDHVKPGMRLVKLDSQTMEPLPGATFRLAQVGGAFDQEFTTDKDGEIDVSTLTTETTNAQGDILLKHLEPGVYEITEITPPVGYLPAEEPTQLITLAVNKLGTVEFTNHAKPSLTIRKVDSITGDPLKGVKFHVTYASNQTHTGEVNDLGDFYTDENGQVIITEIRDGWYKVTEIQTVAGYAIQDPASQEFYLQAGTGKTVTFENTPLSALVVYKFDSETGEAIQGVTFQVRYLAGSSGTGGTVLGTYQTSANGSFVLTGLKAGTYVVEEIASDDGHVIDTAPQTAYLSGKDQDVMELYFGNTPKGSLLVKKIDSVTHAPLSDVEFLATTSDGTVVGNANGKFVTDSTGSILIEGMDPGTTLVVKETQAKAGYVLDDTPQTARIKAGRTVTLEFRNAPKGGLIVQKFDRITKKPLAGAVFKITTSTGEYAANNEGLTSSNGLYTTDEQGQIMLTRLAPATYVVTEIQAPDNYKLDGTAQTVVVNTADTQTLSLDYIIQTPKVVRFFD